MDESKGLCKNLINPSIGKCLHNGQFQKKIQGVVEIFDKITFPLPVPG